jgi:hypothetical protein
VNRGNGLDFVLPLLGPARSHYVPAPSWPGVFEVPCDQPIGCWAPVVTTEQGEYVGGGLPVFLAHSPWRLEATWAGLPDLRSYTEPDCQPLAGERRTVWRVADGALVVDDRLRLDDLEACRAVTVLVPETDVPLSVSASGESVVLSSRIDVDGIAEWRSSWSQLRAVHQIQLAPSSELRWQLRGKPAPR